MIFYSLTIKRSTLYMLLHAKVWTLLEIRKLFFKKKKPRLALHA